MSADETTDYEAPELNEYGTVESLTNNDKIGSQTDEYSEGTPITGSII